MSRIIPDGKGGFILEVSPASDPTRVIPHGRSGEGNEGPAATAISGQKADPPARGQPALMQDPQFKEERQLQSDADPIADGKVDLEALAIYDGLSEDQDYHKTMSSTLWLEWFQIHAPRWLDMAGRNRQVVLVLDNASYHSSIAEAPPRSSAKVADLKDWLKKKGQPEPEGNRQAVVAAFKQFLWNTGGRKQHITYELELKCSLFYSDRIKILRTPPYHCELQPVEKLWAASKTKLRACFDPGYNSGNLKDVTAKYREILEEQIPDELVQKWIDHCIDVGHEFAAADPVELEEMDDVFAESENEDDEEE